MDSSSLEQVVHKGVTAARSAPCARQSVARRVAHHWRFSSSTPPPCIPGCRFNIKWPSLFTKPRPNERDRTEAVVHPGGRGCGPERSLQPRLRAGQFMPPVQQQVQLEIAGKRSLPDRLSNNMQHDLKLVLSLGALTDSLRAGSNEDMAQGGGKSLCIEMGSTIDGCPSDSKAVCIKGRAGSEISEPPLCPDKSRRDANPCMKGLRGRHSCSNSLRGDLKGTTPSNDAQVAVVEDLRLRVFGNQKSK